MKRCVEVLRTSLLATWVRATGSFWSASAPISLKQKHSDSCDHWQIIFQGAEIELGDRLAAFAVTSLSGALAVTVLPVNVSLAKTKNRSVKEKDQSLS